jgi:large subunit ribosomal protein L2
MGKRITQQARGKGSLTFRVKGKAYRYKISYPSLKVDGKAKITKLFNSSAHSSPLVEISIGGDRFLSPATSGVYEGQEIEINGKSENGNILKLKDIPIGTRIFNIEAVPGNGGKYIRSAGCFGTVVSKNNEKVNVSIKKRVLKLDEGCRAIVGVAAGEGRLMKPLVKAGKKHHMMNAKGRKWHRTSPVKVNAIDHPFGGGRGKRIKSKIAKRNSPPGKKVGHIRPKRTGKK